MSEPERQLWLPLVAAAAVLLAPGKAGAEPADAEAWAASRSVELVRALSSKTSSAPGREQVYRSLIELRLKAPERYRLLRRAAAKRPSVALRALLTTVEQDDSRANLMITMLAQKEGSRASVQRSLGRMFRADRPAYRRFRAAVDTYLTSFMDTSYEGFGRSALYRALKAYRSPRRGAGITGLYATALAQIGVLRGLFAAVESAGSSDRAPIDTP